VRRIRIIHELRTLVALLVFSAVIAAVGGLWWANRTGLPDAWRSKIERALATQGLHTDIGKLRYSLRGIEADEVRVYADETRQRVIARANEVVVNVDRTKLARGDVRVERLELHGGSLTLPVDPNDPQSKVLEVKNASGRVLMPGGRRLEIMDARGDVSGIRLEFEALLLGYRQRLSVKDMDNEQAQLYRRKLLSRVIGLLEPWSFDPAKPPVIRIRVEGDLDDPKSVRADLSLQSERMEHGGIALSRVEAAGEMRGRLLVLESLQVEDGGGALKGRMEYDLATRTGRFDAKSNLELPSLLKEIKAAAGVLQKVSFQSRPELDARGNFEWPEGSPPSFHIIGHLAANDVRFAEHSASRVESDISWDGKRVYLDNIEATRPDGNLTARLLIEPDQVRYEASTNLRVSVWRGLFEGQQLGKIFSGFTENKNPGVSGHVEGRFNRHDKHDWSTVGEVRATNMSYKGTPFLWAQTKMTLNHDFLDFHDGSVEFDYSDYAMRKAHGGPMTGKASAGSVRWESAPGTLVFEDIKGTIWPAPVLRMFLPKVADHLEHYRFHRTPKLTANGVIGLFERGSPKTDFRISGTTPGNVSYEFADTDLLLSGLNTGVRVLPGHTEVNDLSFNAYEGPVRGKFDVRYGNGEDLVKGELDWTRLSLPAISKDCGFDKKAKGFVTGRIDVEQRGKGPAGLNGEGLIALEEGELFSVPIFGPLSPVLSTVLANKKAGFQEAKEAFCTFSVKDGVLRTTDFETSTPSLVFTGDATADLNRKTLDMTIRMNARGLFGVITLPLKPFYGLFQFRGTGPLREPKWDNVMFTSPPEDQHEKLTAPPKARGARPMGRNH